MLTRQEAYDTMKGRHVKCFGVKLRIPGRHGGIIPSEILSLVTPLMCDLISTLIATSFFILRPKEKGKLRTY